ncbi:acireductone synthase [Nocardia goodfellowii]
MAAELRPVEAVVLDVEGTVGSIDHVRGVLYPYARARLGDWFAQRRGTIQHAALLDEVRALTGDSGLDEAEVVSALAQWSDGDVKAQPLKAVQSMIWAEGYASGRLEGHVYPEVPTVLDRWRQLGIACYIYSSGTRAAQRNWFAHSNFGDLTVLLNGYFDLAVAGSKREAESYRAITRAIHVPPNATVFLSDVREELDAAALAGWQTIGVRRAGDPRGATVQGYQTLSSLDDIQLLPGSQDEGNGKS